MIDLQDKAQWHHLCDRRESGIETFLIRRTKTDPSKKNKNNKNNKIKEQKHKKQQIDKKTNKKGKKKRK